MTKYKISMETLKKSKIEAKEGTKLKMELKDGKVHVASIIKVEKDGVIVDSE